MIYKIALPSSFKQSVARLRKKYPHVTSDIKVALQVLEQNPFLGTVKPPFVRMLVAPVGGVSRGEAGQAALAID